jgi:uncharacterized protein DUF4231
LTFRRALRILVRMPTEPENAPWWLRLTRPSGTQPPPSVVERLGWYERRVRNARRATYALEGSIIVVAAAIPATVAAGGSAGLAGVLGSIVTALVGVRQLLRLNATWARVSATVVAMQRELVTWSVAAAPYDGEDTRAGVALATAIEGLVGAETTQWTELRSTAEQTLQQR